MLLLLMLLLLGDGQAPRPRPAAPPPAPPARTFFTSTLPPAELRNKQAVLETSQGTIVLDLLADAAPNHVAHFITRAREGAYDGTIFHRVIAMGIIQGGDPLSKDPAQAAKYGTGGLGELRFEASAEKLTRGAVAAVLVPGERDSAGSQFFILDHRPAGARRAVHGVRPRRRRHHDGAEDFDDAGGRRRRRPSASSIRTVTIREKPAPAPEPFTTETVEALGAASRRARDLAWQHHARVLPGPRAEPRPPVPAAGSGRRLRRHRVPPRSSRASSCRAVTCRRRSEPLDERQQAYVRPLAPEFNDTLHDRGIVSMARGDDPGSATSSFFIVLARTPALDRQYTVFGRVVDGMDVVEKIGSGAGRRRDARRPASRSRA